MIRRSGRRRAGVATVGIAVAGVVMSASASGVGARPVVEQLAPGDIESAAVAEAAGPGQGSNASVSGDGRFIVYQGPPGGGEAPAEGDARTSTVYLTDRDTGTTVEVTSVPDGLRAGGSLNPVISGDGCSVAVVTELALDVFRDDDTGSRWDVYVRRLEHCSGGDGTSWQLVSSRADRSALARDDVNTIDPPAISRSGTVIAYTHPADQLIDGQNVTAVSIVDLGQPIVSPSRTQLVAGTPVSSPDTSFVNTGIDQPAISGDGRFVAYRSDATSSDAVAGWGAGAVEGGPATKQVYVWDRNEPDPFDAVRLVSVRTDGEPAVAGASDPSLSRDGRVIAFTSSDVGLVPAVFPPCAPDCPSQVFRLDRDTDENGWFDESGRTSMSMVSAVAGSDPVVAGTAPSSQPSVNADGQLVAFVSKAPNLQLVKASGGGEPGDGDLLVADARLGTLRRVTILADGVQPSVGAHSRPQLSDTGRTTVFDTLAAPSLIPGAAHGRQVVAMTSIPSLSLADADLGSTLVGFTSDEWYVAVINNGPTSFTPDSFRVSDSRFTINEESSTCALGVPVPAGGDCHVRLSFTPAGPGPATALLTVSESGFQAISVTSTVRGAGGEPMLRTNPSGAELGEVVVGTTGYEKMFDVENIALVPAVVGSVQIIGEAAGDFAVTTNSCENKSLNPRSTCSVGITFTPTAPGHRTALARVETTTGQYTTVVLGGDARYVATLNVDTSEVEAGDQFLVGGSGFPPSSTISIFFDDDSTHVVTAQTSVYGDLLHWVPVDLHARGGQRTVVAQAADGTTASAALGVIEMRVDHVGLPGFGFG